MKVNWTCWTSPTNFSAAVWPAMKSSSMSRTLVSRLLEFLSPFSSDSILYKVKSKSRVKIISFFPLFYHIIAQNQRYSHRQLIWSVVIHEKPKCVECLCKIGFIDLSPKPAYSLCTLHYLLLPKLVIKIYSSFFPFLGFEKDWLLGDLISRPWHSKTRRTVTD